MARQMKDSGIEWIGEIPEGWKTVKIKQLQDLSVENSFIDGDWIESPYITDSGIRYLTTGNVGDGHFKEQGNGYISEETFRELNCKYAYPDDFVIARLNAPYGRACILPATHPRYVLAVDIVILRTEANKRYLCYITQCEGYQRAVQDEAKGTTMKRISRTNLGNIVLPIAPLAEQQRIAAFLDRKCAEIDAVIERTKATIEEYKKLKQAVITEAVTKGVRGPRPMKDSGIEWIGEIPEGWEVLPHKYVMHKEKAICEHHNGEDIISLTMNGVIVRDLTAGGKMPTTFDGYQYVEPEDMLLCLFDIDVTPRCVGVVRNYGVTSPAYSRFKVHAGYHNSYYDYLLRFIDDEKVFIHLAKNLRSSLTETDFGAIKTIAPSYEEQMEIAAYLDDKCAAMDTLIAKKTALLTELETYKKSLIYEYVTGKKEVG